MVYFRDDYFRMKLQWTTIRSDQERRFSFFKERKCLIGKLLNHFPHADIYTADKFENIVAKGKKAFNDKFSPNDTAVYSFL